MPFYLRKSVRAGPFRFNFSKGGVGVSVGVRGLRVGTGPRGHYIHAGGGGVYYRASIGHAGENKGNKAPRLSPEQKQAIVFNEPGVNMVEVESGDVLEMRDEAFGSILDEINTKQNKARMSLALPCLLGIVGLLGSYAAGRGGLVLVDRI